jgi:hypothetical protein
VLFVVCLALDGKGGKGLSVVSLLSLKKHVNFDVDVPRSAASRQPCPGDTGITRLQMNIERRCACAEGGYKQD